MVNEYVMELKAGSQEITLKKSIQHMYEREISNKGIVFYYTLPTIWNHKKTLIRRKNKLFPC